MPDKQHEPVSPYPPGTLVDATYRLSVAMAGVGVSARVELERMRAIQVAGISARELRERWKRNAR